MNKKDNHIEQRWILSLLKAFCPSHLYEEIEGDLIQRFNRDLNPSDRLERSDGYWKRRAKRKLIWNVIRFFRPGIVLRNSVHINFISMLMFRNNLLMALRHIRKDKIFSAINISGLSVSMAACLLIFQYAAFELSYDQQHKDAERIYRTGTAFYDGSQLRYISAQCLPQLAPILKEQFTEVEEAGRLLPTFWFDCMLSYNQGDAIKIFNENKLYYADQGYLSLFHPVLLQGDISKALTKPFSAVLSASSSKKYFGNENAIGKVLHLKGSGDENDYTVTGIMNDPLPDSHIDAEILLSENSLNEKSNIGFQSAHTYLKIQSGVSVTQIESKFPALVNTLTPPGSNIKAKLFLQPIADIHLGTALEDEMKPAGSARSVYFLVLVAVAILIIAWINYINLTTARSVARAKEVGVRKVAGATRSQIAFQFLTETIVFNSIGLACAVVLVFLFAPAFYNFVGLSIPLNNFHWLFDSKSLIVLSGFVLCILLIGFFPARILSSFNPVKAMKGKPQPTDNGISFGRAAVVFQFVCAIILMISVFVFNRQFNFMQEQELGIDIKQSIVVKSPANVDSSYLNKLNSFRNELKSLAVIRSVTTSTSVPGEGISWTGEVKRENGISTQDFGIHVIDPEFISSFHLKLLAGRNLEEKDIPLAKFGDKLEPVLLNKEAVTRLGYKEIEDVIGEYIFWDKNKCIVAGVIDNFHQESLKKAFQPTLYTANRGPAMTIKLTEGTEKNLSNTLAEIQHAWNTYFPNNPFDYYFLEDSYNKQYADDEQIARLFHFFCLLAMIISSMGLFALSLFAVSQRTKEITIRKVLGAPLLHLIQLLTKEYFILISVAMMVALPLTYYGVNQWLNEFAYRMEVSIWIFILPVLIVLIIAALTVGGHTIKAALRNPTEGLKHE